MSTTHTLDQFKPLVGQGFRLDYGDHGETLTLVEAVESKYEPGPGMPKGFSLVFEGENKTIMLGQHTYRLDAPELGRIEIFLACIGRKPDGSFRYQSVFG